MYRIDPDRIDLVLAFRANPLAAHAGDMAALCNALRMGPIEGKYVLLEARGGASWELGQLHARRDAPVTRLGVHFHDRADAEWEVFRMRWEASTGRTLPP